MKLLFQYVRRHKRILIIALFLALINQVFSLLDPQITRLLIDKYATNFSSYTVQTFVTGVLGLLGLYILVSLISRIAKSFQDYCTNVASQRVGTAMYAESVNHTFSLPFELFEDRRSGEILQKMQKARTDAQSLVQSAVGTIFLTVISIILVVGYALYVHWIIGLTYILIIPIVVTATFLISRRIRTVQRKIVSEGAELAGTTIETLRNVELVKGIGIEEQEIKRLNSVNEYILKLELKKVKLVRTLIFIQGTMINAVRALIIFVLSYLIFLSKITLGEFYALLFYSFAVLAPLYELSTVASQYQETKASMEELKGILSLPVAKEPKNPVIINSIESIQLKKVSFGYKSGGQRAVENISLAAKAGETIAFVGPSGSGKSTLVKLLLGLYQPIKGTIFINNKPLSLISKKDYRAKIGLVSQETQLFASTIKENLLFVKPHATDKECLSALKKAAAMGILKKGPWGLDTRIGEGGLKLSGGERQRLAIARALLRNPEMIIFDEATSSLDSITEKSITETIEKINFEKNFGIIIIIAHRLSTVAHADKIYVLERGHIVEEGDHRELLKKGGLYEAMWREQRPYKA